MENEENNNDDEFSFSFSDLGEEVMENIASEIEDEPSENIIKNEEESKKMNDSELVKSDYKSKLNVNFLAEKGGMKNVDKERIEKIIYETTKNSRRYKRDQEDNKLIQKCAEETNKKLDIFHKNKILYEQVQKMAMNRLDSIKTQRRMDKIWMHLDMDMFFAAVEIRDDPSLKDKPIAVGNKAMVSTSNYVARKYGVRSAMPGFIALKLCPQLVFVDGHYNKYREESAKIMGVLEEYDYNIESMGLDEAYVDLTDYCKEHNIKTKEDIQNLAKNIKNQIKEKTQLSCSVGIACNKTLAKICSDFNKPDGLTYLEYDEETIIEFTSKLSIRKIPFIGNKTEKRLNFIGIKTCKDLMDRYVDLYYLDEDSFEFYMKSCLGIGRYEHSEIQEEKSISRSESFYMTGDTEFLKTVLNKLKNKVYKDMDKQQILNCKTVGVEITGFTERKTSKCFTNKNGFHNRAEIDKIIFNLFNELIEREKKARMVRVRVSGLIRANPEDEKKGVIKFLNNLKADYKSGLLPKKDIIKNYSTPKPSKRSKINLKDTEEGKDYKSNKKGECINSGEKNKTNESTKIKSKKNSKGRTTIKVKKNNVACKDILKLIENMKKAINENNKDFGKNENNNFQSK